MFIMAPIASLIIPGRVKEETLRRDTELIALVPSHRLFLDNDQ